MRKSIPVFVLFFVLGAACNQAATSVENEGPDGGDGLVADFMGYGRELGRTLKQVRRIHGFPDGKLASIRERLPDTVVRTKVLSAERVYLATGVEVSAANYASKGMIRVSRARWPELDDKGAKHRLVLHEYLGAMGEREANYEVTDALLTGISDLLDLPPEQAGPGPFLISDCSELQLRLSRVTEGKKFVLASDINCSDSIPFRPIPLFKGTLDGRDLETHNTHEVYGIQIRNGDPSGPEALFAPFHVSTGTIQNVIFSNVTVDVRGTAAGLVADNKGVIDRVWVIGSVRGSEIGGISARNFGLIQGVRFDGQVDSSNCPDREDTGGAVAMNFGEIHRALVNGRVIGTRNVGGIAGINYGLISHSEVERSEVSGEENIGGVVGKNQSGSGDTWFGSGRIETCKSSGKVSAVFVRPATPGRTLGNVGGVVGYNKSLVSNSWSSMDVCAPEGDSNIGLVSGINAIGVTLVDTSSVGRIFRPCQ